MPYVESQQGPRFAKKNDTPPEQPPLPMVNNVIQGNKIKSELFKRMHEKPVGYKNLEIKTVINSKSYRVNVVCTKKGEFIDTVIRPLSYYVSFDGEEMTFNPPVK